MTVGDDNIGLGAKAYQVPEHGRPHKGNGYIQSFLGTIPTRVASDDDCPFVLYGAVAREATGCNGDPPAATSQGECLYKCDSLDASNVWRPIVCDD